MRRWTMLMVALAAVVAFGTSGHAQTPSSSGDKMEKDKMTEKGKSMEKDTMTEKGKMTETGKMIEKGKAMGKDTMMDKKDDKMMDKK